MSSLLRAAAEVVLHPTDLVAAVAAECLSLSVLPLAHNHIQLLLAAVVAAVALAVIRPHSALAVLAAVEAEDRVHTAALTAALAVAAHGLLGEALQ
jgi:uncharacterized protein YdhG (YjbR/CyaY superfamily)